MTRKVTLQLNFIKGSFWWFTLNYSTLLLAIYWQYFSHGASLVEWKIGPICQTDWSTFSHKQSGNQWEAIEDCQTWISWILFAPIILYWYGREITITCPSVCMYNQIFVKSWKASSHFFKWSLASCMNLEKTVVVLLMFLNLDVWTSGVYKVPIY